MRNVSSVRELVWDRFTTRDVCDALLGTEPGAFGAGFGAGGGEMDVPALLGTGRRALPRPFTIGRAADRGAVYAYRLLRRRVFVEDQGLFPDTDLDFRDDDPRTVILVARDPAGTVIGGVRLGPADDGPDIGWWRGGRLVVAPGQRGAPGVGPALVRAACAYAEDAGVIRFEADVQARHESLFVRLGWHPVRPSRIAGVPHVLMRWPIGRIAATAAGKASLGPLLRGMAVGGRGFVGDDGAPVPDSELVAACDAILPSMVERDPDWAGWCSVLVNVNDLAAMGAVPVGLLDALGARDASFAARVMAGLRRAADAYEVPILGGHTQLGVPAALSVTALGRAPRPVPGGGGRPGHRVHLTADLGGRWRPGYTGRQWDSTSTRTPAELHAMVSAVARARPDAAKDVSMAGITGTLGMLAEASGCGATLDVARVPRPSGATMGDWLTCFPGYAMLTTDPLEAGPAVSAGCGELTASRGVRLRWPDGEVTEVLGASVTGLGAA
ncbi:MSMEG_0567/sll0787 family protein [Acrocarpospora catenulata]|uniref:MSMEG_0567/sll0787 family protein n=1 Tax=Acrocarpospora catenulata TaxID=2836182 RepID=UPI001BD912CB|nr:MSMEG_0567/sll0787 family protein [Acrocarpospora catenulata]